MRNRNRSTVLVFSLWIGLLSSSAWATKLVLVGGGNRPPAAMAELAEAGGGKAAKALIIGWSSEQPEVYFETISSDLRAQKVKNFIPSLRGPATVGEVGAFTEDFLRKLSKATIVFFTGGDQTKHMRVISLPGIAEALRAKFSAGTPFAGTSAGTAIMSRTMLTGSGSEIAPGLGLLPEGILIDQHGRREGRVERDFEAMRRHGIPRAILIDENNAIVVKDGKTIHAIGPDWVNLYEMHAGEIETTVLHEGDVVGIPSHLTAPECTRLLYPL